jgi:cytochrome c oxidase subunit 3
MAHEIEYGTTGQPHPYHILRPSIWPLMASIAGGLFAVGMIMFMHDAVISGMHVGKAALAIGVLSILGVMFGWWREVIHESVVEKAHSPIAALSMRYGMILFIASEFMLFVAFFWAFFASALYPVESIGSTWPPEGMSVIAPFDLPLMMTLILLLSGCTVTWAHHAIIEGNNKDVVAGLGFSVLLGALFLYFQYYEYAHSPFAFGANVYSSTFFMSTGFHGFHVFIGTVFLLVCYIRARKKHFTPKSHFGFEAAAWYWHFVDVVWLFLFVAIYVWGNLHSGTAIFAAH